MVPGAQYTARHWGISFRLERPFPVENLGTTLGDAE